MSHELTSREMNIPGLKNTARLRIKDSILLIIVFIIGLLGTCYILHFALSENGATGFQLDDGHRTQKEAIYLTSSN